MGAWLAVLRLPRSLHSARKLATVGMTAGCGRLAQLALSSSNGVGMRWVSSSHVGMSRHIRTASVSEPDLTLFPRARIGCSRSDSLTLAVQNDAVPATVRRACVDVRRACVDVRRACVDVRRSLLPCGGSVWAVRLPSLAAAMVAAHESGVTISGTHAMSIADSRTP
jgi:hypothetical protein